MAGLLLVLLVLPRLIFTLVAGQTKGRFQGQW